MSDQPELVPLASYLAARERIAALEAALAAAREREAALAELMRRAQKTGIWSDGYDAQECRRLKDDMAKFDLAEVVARVRCEAALEEGKER